jgi:hypothetical protein
MPPMRAQIGVPRRIAPGQDGLGLSTVRRAILLHHVSLNRQAAANI